MRIVVSGTPGTGKTVVADVLAKRLGFDYVSVNDFAEELGLFESEDPERKSIIVDEKKVAGELEKLDDVVIEGHFAHFVKCDYVFVLRTRPDRLAERLHSRDWSKEKIEENLEAEVAGVCIAEAVDENDRVFEVDTSDMSAEETAEIIKSILDGKEGFEAGHVDWLS